MDEIFRTIQGARTERRNHILNSFSNVSELREQDSIRKADDEEIEDEEFETEDDEENEEEQDEKKEREEEKEDEEESDEADGGEETEKSHISEALMYSGDIKISKTGKEIKQKVDSEILPKLNAELAKKESEALEKVKECGKAPSEDPSPYWTNEVDINVGFKVYKWDETCLSCGNDRIYETLSAEDEKEKIGNAASSAKEAENRREYNNIVMEICKIKTDIRACEVLQSLDDKKRFELTPRQILVLGF